MVWTKISVVKKNENNLVVVLDLLAGFAVFDL